MKSWVLINATWLGPAIYFHKFDGCQPGKFKPSWTFNKFRAMRLPLETNAASLDCIKNQEEYIVKIEMGYAVKTKWVKR